MRLYLLVAIAALVFAGSASAATDFTSSTLTAPGNASFLLFTQDAPNNIHVTGTTAGGDSNADLVCYFGTVRKVLASNVTVTAGAIDANVPLQPLGMLTPRPYCVLRAVPTGDVTDYPPGAATTFAGSEIGVGIFSTFPITTAGPNQGLVADFLAGQAQKKGLAQINSIGSCGLYSGFIFDPVTFAESSGLFDCNGWMKEVNGCGAASGTCLAGDRSDLQVDGDNAYFPETAVNLWFKDATHNSAGLQNFPQLNFDKTIDPVTGDLRLTENEQIAKCSPNGRAFHLSNGDAAWPGDCSSFALAGVKLDRTVVVDREGRRVTFTDVWSSTDNAPHTLDMLYEQDFLGDPGNFPSPSFEYPWIGPAFTSPTLGETVSGPAADAPTTVYADGNAGTVDTFAFPQGALTFSDAPSDIHWTYRDPSGYFAGTVHFTRTVPAGGSVTIAHSYISGETKGEVTAQIPAEQARLGRPKVAITNPASGSIVTDPNVTVTGTATDPGGGVTAFTVNGEAVTVAADGTWSKAMTLAGGSNTITAIAGDADGNSTTASSAVTYTPVVKPTTSPPVTDKAPPLLGLTVSRTKLRALLAKGLPVNIRCSEPCRFVIAVTVDSKTGKRFHLSRVYTFARKSGRLTVPSVVRKVFVKPSRKTKRKLRKARSLRLTVTFTAKDAAGNAAKKTKRVTVKR